MFDYTLERLSLIESEIRTSSDREARRPPRPDKLRVRLHAQHFGGGDHTSVRLVRVLNDRLVGGRLIANVAELGSQRLLLAVNKGNMSGLAVSAQSVTKSVDLQR